MLHIENFLVSRAGHVSHVFKTAGTELKQITFTSTDLAEPAALEKLHSRFPNEQRGKFYLYTVSIEGGTPALLDRVRKAFRDASETTRWNMSRDNHTHPTSAILYVGTSRSMFAKFRYHLGTGKGRSTYSLFLSAWAAQLQARFVVNYYEFSEVVTEDVELIESMVWDELKPMFGKRRA
jgi:hypothetical protein